MKTLVLVLVALLASLSIGCDALTSCLENGCGDDDDAKGKDESEVTAGDAANQPGAPMCVTGGKPHIGLGDEDVAAKDDGPANGDRARIKPFSALTTEYARVLGRSPASLTASAPTFGIAQKNWFLEPIASGVFLSQAFEVAFEGCSDLTENDAKFAVAPTPESAHDACSTWTQRFWSRSATPEEINACVSAAMETEERKWAYACASVLTATGFLTY